jgi:DNA-binding transcriptional LysR family regulator
MLPLTTRTADAGNCASGRCTRSASACSRPRWRTWRRKYPDIQARLVEFRHTNDLIAAMEAEQADLAVGPTPSAWEGPVREIGAEEFVLAAAPGAQLPGPGPGTAVSLADLADRDWVHFTPPSGLADVLDAACAAAGFAPRAAVRTEQVSSALNLAYQGLGVTLLPGNVVPPAFDGVPRRLDPPVQRMLSAYTRVRPDPITAAFVEAICHHTMATPTHILSLLEPSQDG